MLQRTNATMTSNPAVVAASAAALGGAATILGAWFFQYGLGIVPCPLCLEQRMFHYVGIPLAALVAFAAARNAPKPIVIGGLGLLAAIFLAGAGLAVYHAGIEWKWWTGPQACSGEAAALTAGKTMLERLQETRIVRCDEAPWRFLGLSLAGYNVLISLALAGIALAGIAATRRRPPAAYGSSSVSQ
jgi:disulfide bond formation protein DsbB